MTVWEKLAAAREIEKGTAQRKPSSVSTPSTLVPIMAQKAAESPTIPLAVKTATQTAQKPAAAKESATKPVQTEAEKRNYAARMQSGAKQTSEIGKTKDEPKKTTQESTAAKPASSASTYLTGGTTTPATPYAAGLQAQELKKLDIKQREKKTSEPQKAQTPAWMELMNLSSEELEQRHETAKAERDALSGQVAREETPAAASSYAAVAGRYKAKETNPIPSVAAASGVWDSMAYEEGKRLNSLRMDLSRKQDEVNDLAAAHYHRKNQEQLAKLETDAVSKTKFRSAQELTTDLDTISKALSAPTTYNSQDTRFKSDGEAIKKKYGTDDLQALQRTLTAQKAQMVKELEAKGYDFETMAGYDLMLRQQEEYIKRQERMQKEAEEHPVWSSGLSVILKPLQPVDFFRTSLNSVGHSNADDLGSYVPANVYDMHATNMVQTIRGTVSKKIEENTDWEIFGQNVGSFLYNTGMSMADSALMVSTLGPGSTYLMGLSAAAEKSREIIAQGGSNSQAFWGGLSAGVAEYVFEKFSVENLLKIKGTEGWKAKVKVALRQGGIEASEEMLTECANIISDAMVMGDRSGLSTAIKEYKEQGMTEDKAVLQACLDSIGQVAVAGAGGFISGVGMAGGKLAISQAGKAIYNRLTQNQQTTIPAIQGAVEGAKNASTVEAGESVRVGRATVIQQPYDGPRPVYKKSDTQKRTVVEIKKVSAAQERISQSYKQEQQTGKSFRNFLTDIYEKIFQSNGGQRGVAVSGVTMDGAPYIVTLNKGAVGKVISDKNVMAEKLAILDVLDDVVEAGEYVGSGKYVPRPGKNKKTIRYDYFETPATISGKDYIVAFDVEVFPNTNNYRTHRVINEMDIIPASSESTGTYQAQNTSRADVGTHQPQGLEEQSPSTKNIIPQTTQEVNPETEIPQAASQPIDPLIADIRAKGARQAETQGQTALQPIDPLIADIRAKGARQTDIDATALQTAQHLSENMDLQSGETGDTINDIKTSWGGSEYGGEERTESRQEFRQRSAGEGITIFEGSSADYGYKRVEGTSQRSGEIWEELKKLGIKADITDGTVWRNQDGISSKRAIPEAATVGGQKVLISDTASLSPKYVAGHEAFHFWKSKKERQLFAQTLEDNLDFTSRAFLDYQSTIAQAYFGEEIDLTDRAQLQALREELFAYLSGDIHEGENDVSLRAMFRDFDAVKKAWEKLIQSGEGSSGQFVLPKVSDAISDGRENEIHVDEIRRLLEIQTQGQTVSQPVDPLIADIRSRGVTGKSGTQTAVETQKTATDGVAGLPKMTMADFTDVNSSVWNNVDYKDKEKQRVIMEQTRQEMVDQGEVVHIPDETVQKMGEFYPDLRTKKKVERNPILKQKIAELKTALCGLLSELKGTHEFEVNGNVLEVTLYDAGVDEVLERITQNKAAMLNHSGEVFRKARYMYSTQDYNGDPNVYRWNYFYTPVQIGEEIVGVRIAVKDLARGTNMVPESQLYHWGIKKDVSVDGGRRDPKVASPGVSLDTPSKISIPQTTQEVKQGAGKDMATPASQPVDPLIADIRAKGARQTDADTEYQIKTLPDGKKYVQADRQVIFGNDPESWSSQLEDYINGKIRKGENVQLVAADGDILNLTTGTAGKVSSPFRGDGTRLSDVEFERKVAAGAHIDELVEVSTSVKKGAKDEGGVHDDFAKHGWNYRVAFFRDFDGTYYRITVSAAMNDDGTIVYNVGKMRKRDFPNYTGSSAKGGAQGVEGVSMGSLPTVTGSSAKGGAQNGEKASLGDSISQPGGEVKSKAGISQAAVQGQTASQPVDPLIADIRSRGAGQTDTDATANFAKVAGTEKGLVYDDYVKNELAKETADRINTLAKRLNLRVRFVDSIANGVADGQIVDADIQIAKDAQNPIMVVLGHEVGHWLEKTAPKEYQTIQQFVPQRQQAEIDYRIAEYETVGKALDYDAAQREFANDYIGEMIANPETLNKFINENRENRTLLQKVADALRALWQKLTGRERQQVKTAEDALLAALRASEKQTAALEKAGQTMDFSTEMAEAGAEYSIKNTRKMTWEDQIKGWFAQDGTIKSSDSLYLGESEVWLDGVTSAPLYVPGSVMNKATRSPKGSKSGHSLTQAELTQIPARIKSAPAVIVNPSRNALIYVTDMMDSHGWPVVAAFNMNNDLYGETAHGATSIYGRESGLGGLLGNLGEDATIFVRNKNKFDALLSGTGKSYPQLLAKVKFADVNIAQPGGEVNGEFSLKDQSWVMKVERESAASQPIDPLITDIRSRGAGQTVTQPIDPLIADIRSRGAEQKAEQGDKAEAHTQVDNELKISAEDGKITSGAISGALNPISKAAAKHAKTYYGLVRSMSEDCKKIAAHTGLSESDIRIIKDYLFIEEHDLSEGHKQFDPSYDIARSWQRLMEGTEICPHDITLLKHELLEMELTKQGYSQDEAHKIASLTYNYTKEVEEYNDKTGLYKKGK